MCQGIVNLSLKELHTCTSIVAQNCKKVNTDYAKTNMLSIIDKDETLESQKIVKDGQN